jgi:hypothetical protein
MPGKKTAGETKLTKNEAVRRALAELGKDAKPTAIQTWVKEQFRIEMSKDHISVCKGKMLRGKKLPARQAEAKKPTAGGIVLDDILAVKKLADKVGPEQLRTLIDAFAK